MTDIALLDRMARNIMGIIVIEENSTFSGALLNSMVDELVETKMRFCENVLNAQSVTPRYLFEDIELSQITVDFLEAWTSDTAAMMAKPPMLVTIDNAKSWRARPGFEALAASIGGNPLFLTYRGDEITRNGRNYVQCVIRPAFPEWYVLAVGANALPDASRIGLLETFQESVRELMDNQDRLDEEEIDQLYFFFVREILPRVQAAATQDEDARRAMKSWMGLYGLCGIGFDPENIDTLPSFYKEYAILFFQSFFDKPFVPILRKLAQAST